MSAFVNQIRLWRKELSARGGTFAYGKQVRYLERQSLQGSLRNFTLVLARDLSILRLMTSLSRFLRKHH